MQRKEAGRTIGSESEERGDSSSVDSEKEKEDTLALHVETLEEEAKSLARGYALSLSRQLLLDEEPADQKGSKIKKKRYNKSIKQEVPDHLLPKVAILGRPNVGKSALFNRIAGGNLAIVVDEPGVTRDRLYGRSFWGDNEFMVVDTGGVISIPKSQSIGTDGLAITAGGGEDSIAYAVREATAAGLPSMIERQAAAAVKEASVIIFLVDGQAGVTAADIEIADWLRKNHSEKTIILAVNKCESQRKGLMQAAEFWSLGFTPIPISAISGTGTGYLLDLVCSELKVNETYCLIDTAGIRRRAAVAAAGSKTESLSVNRAFRAIRRSDVVALVLDAVACVTEQVRLQMFWGIITAASSAEKERSRRLSTSILNQVVQEAVAFKPPPRSRGGKRGRVYYCTQAAIRPPTFVFFVNDAKYFPDTYRRYMEKQLRSNVGFPGTPIRLLWRSKKKQEKKLKEGERETTTATPPFTCLTWIFIFVWAVLAVFHVCNMYFNVSI